MKALKLAECERMLSEDQIRVCIAYPSVSGLLFSIILGVLIAGSLSAVENFPAG